MYKIPKGNFCDLSDKEILYKSIESSCNLLTENKQYTALLLYSVCCIDAFSKNKFKKYVGENFKQYFDNGLLTEHDFYKEFRCKIVHGHSIGGGYAIAEDWEVHGEHVAKVEYEGRVLIALNIEKFIDDFRKHVKNKFSD